MLSVSQSVVKKKMKCKELVFNALSYF